MLYDILLLLFFFSFMSFGVYDPFSGLMVSEIMEIVTSRKKSNYFESVFFLVNESLYL